MQFENENGVIPCNKYEQITTSYLLSVLEYNTHKTVMKWNADVTAVICTLIHNGFLPVISMVRT